MHTGLKDETYSYVFAINAEKGSIFLYTCNQQRTLAGKLNCNNLCIVLLNKCKCADMVHAGKSAS